MAEKKWKYAKPRGKFNFDEYLILPEDKKFKITIKNWTFDSDSEHRTVFRTDVIKINGKDSDKRLVIKKHDNVQELKKALAKKTSVKSTAELEISRHYDKDEFDYYFKMKFLK